ncbi:MAG: hypothetical protein HC796_11805 [Synechococcaceae cyanobacterium RL_1_2]|nr:hypothetical protein [Synechococcaceae cyanobacterium RL_1_2]
MASKPKNQNKKTHGIFSKFPPMIDDPDREIFDNAIARLSAQFAPLTFPDEMAIENIAQCWLGLKRLWRYQALLIEDDRLKRSIAKVRGSTAGGENEVERLLRQLTGAPPPPRELGELDQARSDLWDGVGVIDDDEKIKRLQAQEAHLNRIISRCLEQLERGMDSPGKRIIDV